MNSLLRVPGGGGQPVLVCGHGARRPCTSPQQQPLAPVCSSRRQAACYCVAEPQQCAPQEAAGSSRRRVLLLGSSLAAGLVLAAAPQPARAVGFKKELKKRKVPLEEYAVSELDGLRYYDVEEGRGKAIRAGDSVVVHFDCKFKGIDAVSSRYARTLGGNRTIAEPLEFVAGEAVNMSAKKAGDSAGGLFAGGSGPKPPPAISSAVVGMKQGGKRIVRVDVPELGYPRGNQEIPAGAAFDLEIEVLSLSAAASRSSSSGGSSS